MRLIDADALIDDMCEDCGAIANGACDKDVCASVLWVKDAPTIEAEPVRHGRWIHTDKAASWKPSCRDECGECHYHDKDRRDLSDFKFCPMCGSKMDGGEEES